MCWTGETETNIILGMVQPSEAELTKMRAVAGEIRDSLDADAYKITNAVAQHAAFMEGSGPAGAFERALVKYAATRGASAAGVYAQRVSGGLDLISQDGNVIRNYRVKTARRRADGGLDLVCGVGSALIADTPSESFFREERWVLGFITDDDHLIDEIFIAEIVGHRGLNPLHLELGRVYNLTPAPMPPDFTSAHEDLEGFEEDDEEGTESA